jgi:SAM-dependent methyltransferase
VPDRWAHLAERYEEAYGPKKDSPCWPRAEALAGRVRGRVLDLACGPGSELALFEQAIGLDSSPGMLRAARRRAPSAALVLGDMRHLPFKRGSFGAAFSCLALIHLSKAELAATLKDLAGLVEPGGPVAMVFFAGEGERDTGFSPLNPRAIAHYSFYESIELATMFEQAAFRDVAVEAATLDEPLQAAIPCLCVTATA